MAITRETVTYNLDDAKIRPLLTDPVGGSPTYGSSIDIPVIQSHTAQAELVSAELKGDAKIVDVYSKTEKFTGQVRHGAISFDALAVLLGGTASTSGSSPTQQQKFSLKGADIPGYFMLESQIKYVGGAEAGIGADLHPKLHKVKITGLSVEYANESHAVVSFDYMAIPLQSTDDLIEWVKNETAVAIETSDDTTPPTVTGSAPADGAAGVAVDSDITFTFSEAMAAHTVSDPGCYFLITEAGAAKAFTVAYNAGTRTATLSPTTDLAATTQYRAGVTRLAQDAAGNRLAAQYIIDFETV